MNALIKILFITGLFFLNFQTTQAQTPTCTWLCNDSSHTLSAEQFCARAGGYLGNIMDFNTMEMEDVCAESPQRVCASMQVPVCCCGTGLTNPLVRIVNTPPDTPSPRIKPPNLQIDLGIDFTEAVCTVTPGDNTCVNKWLGEYLTAIYDLAMKFGGLIAAIMLMAGGVLWLISGGDASKVNQAKEILAGSVAGLTILLSSYLLLTIANPNLVNFRGLTLIRVQEKNLPDTEATAGGTALPEEFAQACAATKAGNIEPCRRLGNKRPPNLTRVSSGVFVDPVTYDKYTKAMACVSARNDGKDLFFINEGFRSARDQIRLRDQETRQGTPDNAAPPCCSNHSSGVAIDINRLDRLPMSFEYNDTSGLKTCMNEQGLFANIIGEAWHWSPTGR